MERFYPPRLAFMQAILQRPDTALTRRYVFDYGIPKEARIHEHNPKQTENFFEGITTSDHFANRLNPLSERYMTIFHEPTTADQPITTSDVIITKPREITTAKGPLYIRLLFVKQDDKVTQLEMYSKSEDLQQVLETTKKATIVAPKLVTYALEGTDNVYDAAYQEDQVAIRIIDPFLESVFQFGEHMDTERDTAKILSATKSVADIFEPPVTPESFQAPTEEALDTYLHHEQYFTVEHEWNGYDFSTEKKFPQADLGEGVQADIFCYRVRNKQTGKVTRLVTTQSIYDALRDGTEIKEARMRPDTKCACHINPDNKCGCDIEFRSSLRQGLKEDPKGMIMIALDTNGVGLNNGLLALHEQDAWRRKDPTLSPEKRQAMMEAAVTDHRNFSDQVNILLTTAMKLHIPNLGIIATNGKKINTFIDAVKAGVLDNQELPETMISIFSDSDYYARVQASLPQDGIRMQIIDNTYRPTRRTPEEIIIAGRQGLIAQYGGIYILPK